jgi:hypothetical protein
MLSQVPLSMTPLIIGRGRTETTPVSPKVQLWLCDQSLAPEHASVAVASSHDGVVVEDLYSGMSFSSECRPVSPWSCGREE